MWTWKFLVDGGEKKVFEDDRGQVPHRDEDGRPLVAQEVKNNSGQ
jgi:hypothetical protein